ncbi:hypothetical protein [Cryptosporangium arvum]|uniref:Uncharacterized protein n=1 Tax=Cryptosporangium arvum DSM 44712 TaxID=927661 RepID=A0A010YZ82_9ACTN|nr:hypothetical protein [Cryptosporangium arvum]EXG80533.1 hypothetical protein CryarDRAFT_1613 [Cryptosporangium arvum DSM 44712]
MSGDLERRYARVLRLYPKAYRRERGPELLATLLEASARPKRRELPALLLGALRAHAGSDRRTAGGTWVAASRVAALMVLVYAITTAPVRAGITLAYGLPHGWWLIEQSLPELVAAPVGLLALAAAVLGRHRIALGVTSVAFLVGLGTWLTDTALEAGFFRYLFAALLLLPAVRTAPPPVSGLLRYALSAPALLVAADRIGEDVVPAVAGIVGFGAFVAVWFVALFWAVVDERVTLAVGLFFLAEALLWPIVLAVFTAGGASGNLTGLAVTMALTALVPTVLLSVSAIAVRRQARL